MNDKQAEHENVQKQGYIRFIFIIVLSCYQKILSPFLGQRCRFYPTCSEYARQCFLFLPLARAILRSTWRLLRCHPFSNGYEDEPFPKKTS